MSNTTATLAPIPQDWVTVNRVDGHNLYEITITDQANNTQILAACADPACHRSIPNVPRLDPADLTIIGERRAYVPTGFRRYLIEHAPTRH